MTDNQREALRLLGSYTAGRFDVWMLSGPANAGVRARIMALLMGIRVAKNQAGVNAMWRAFFALARAENGCYADREAQFMAWAKEQVTGTETM